MITKDKNQSPAGSYILTDENSSFYKQLGCEEALAKISMLFHIKINSDQMLNKYFATTEMLTQITQQRSFICHIINGPISLQGEDPLLPFRPILSNRIGYIAMASHLKQSLHELEYDEMLIEEIMENLNYIQNNDLYHKTKSS